MRFLFTLLFIITCVSFPVTFIEAQSSGSVRLGSQITLGVTSSGCSTACVTNVSTNDPTFICDPYGTGNSIQTMTHSLSVPAGNFMRLMIVTNACESSTDGLDDGDSFSVNGVTIVTGSNNTRVNYNGCFINNGTLDMDIPLSLIANRRDETVTATWTLYTNNPGGNCNTAAPLPILLKNFGVLLKDKSSILTFSTASETNNDYFTIERSVDGRNFEAIGEIKGAGNSSEELTYEFIDDSPLLGINYYRIKQTDFDGQYSYTEIKSVRHRGTASVTISPRSTEGRLDITTAMEDYSMVVYNGGGQEVQRFDVLSGDQSVSIDALQAGIYFIKVTNGSESETLRIVKF